MNETEMDQLKQLLKDAIASGKILEKDRRGRGFVCPVCGNGTGKRGDGIGFIHNEAKLFCFSCGKSFDPLDVLKIKENLPDFPTTLKRAVEITGFRPLSGFSYNPSELSGNASLSPKQDRVEYRDGLTEKRLIPTPKKDYSAYFEECSKRNKGSELGERGISLEVQRKHNIGVDPKWKNPNNKNDSQVPRIIIPTSSGSYLARKIEKTDPKDPERIRKAGEAHFLNEETLFDHDDPRPCFIVEGEIDALSFEEIGFRAVGIGGTSGPNRLKKILGAISDPPILILALDNDEAGEKAQNGEKDASGLLDPNNRGLYYDLVDQGFQVYRVDYEGVRYKDANEYLCKDREKFIQWADDQTIEARRVVEEERERYFEESENALDDFDQDVLKISTTTPTGFSELDRILGGGLRVGLTTLGAGTSFGKTALTMGMAENIARNGSDVLFFSLEMGKNELRARSFSRLSKEAVTKYPERRFEASSYSEVLDYPRMRDGEKKEAITEARKVYRSYCRNLHIVESQGEFSVVDVRKAVSKHKRLTGRAPVVFIDYLQILHPLNPRESEKQQTDKNILELRRLAREFSIPVVVLSSLNRAGYKKRPTLESFKESGGVEYGSDVVIMLSFEMETELYIETIDEESGKKKKVFDYDRAKRQNPRKMLLSVLKNRNGKPTGIDPVFFYSRYSLFEERTIQEEGATTPAPVDPNRYKIDDDDRLPF